MLFNSLVFTIFLLFALGLIKKALNRNAPFSVGQDEICTLRFHEHNRKVEFAPNLPWNVFGHAVAMTSSSIRSFSIPREGFSRTAAVIHASSPSNL